MSDEWGGWWTEAKLEVLRKYLAGFTRASTKARATIYLDLFAGMVSNVRPDTGAEYAGSTTVALRTEPPFTRLVFWELEGPAATLEHDLAETLPGDHRFTVVGGDCNLLLEEGLAAVSELRWAPTFAFIDPKGLDVAWTTLERLARWRQDRKGRKVELWVLFPEPALERVLGLGGVQGENTADKLTRLYGCDDWIAIHQRRRKGEFTADQARAEYVNLLRWRLEKNLGYKRTHALQLGNVSDVPMYSMVFATDEPAGDKIMRDVYGHASVHEIPAMRSHAVGARAIRRDLAKGVARLFDPGGPAVEPKKYVHEPLWEPPERLDAPVELDAEPEDESPE